MSGVCVSLEVWEIKRIIVDCMVFFFFNDTATTEIYTLSLHDALPISHGRGAGEDGAGAGKGWCGYSRPL